MKIPEQTTSWCVISRTVWTNAFANPWGFPLRAAINWSCSSLHTPAVYYIITWQPSSSVSSYSDPIACCLVFLVLPVLHSIFKCACWVIFAVATLAVSRWTNWCLCCYCVSAGAQCMTRLSVGSFRIHSHLPELVVHPWLAVVELVSKVITKRSGKSCGIYSQLQVKMEWVTANMQILLKTKPKVYSCRLHGVLTVPRCAVSVSDVACLFTGLHCGEQQLKSDFW